MYIYIYIFICKWGLYGDTVLITPVLFQGIVRQRHVGSRPPTKLRKERVPLPCTIETLETVRKTSKQLANRHIRNRDNSAHRLSAVGVGSQLPSEAEYLRAVNQRRVRTIVKSDQHQHRKDARRQRRNAIYL